MWRNTAQEATLQNSVTIKNKESRYVCVYFFIWERFAKLGLINKMLAKI